MLFHHARQATRVGTDGSVVLLEDQDRNQWDPLMINEASDQLEEALRPGQPGPFVLQAAIRGPARAGTDRRGNRLAHDRGAVRPADRSNRHRSAELNRAVAVAMVDGPAAAWRSWIA
jgi:RNA polymerase sigma-70 factor (ECF subfamily)